MFQMNTYTRYLIRLLLGPTLFVTLSLTGIIWLAQSLRFIDLIVNKGLSIATFLYFTLLMMPSLLGLILPLSLFIAVLYSYNKLLVESELVVLENVGLSKMQLARPALIVAAGITLLGYLISLWLQPASYREFKDMQSFIRNNYASLLLQEEVFNTPIDGLTVYIRQKLQNGTLKGIFVHDGRDPEHRVTLMAEEGKLVQTPAGPRFILSQGNQQAVDPDRGQLSLLHFDRYSLDLSIYAKAATSRWREPKERYLHELFFPQDDTPEHLLSKLHAEGHQRLTWPLYSMGLTLLALAALLSGQFNRRGQFKRIGVGTAIAIIVVGLGISATSIATGNSFAAALMYINVLLPCWLSIRFLQRVQQWKIPQRPSFMRESGEAV